MIVTCLKIGSGTDDDPFRPDTQSTHWQVKEDRGVEFVIEIFDESPSLQ